MKLILASYFEEDNHGHGRKIGVAPSKPKDLPYDCDFVFSHLSPEDLYWEYHKNKKNDPELAGKIFVENFEAKLKDFSNAVVKEAEEKGISNLEVLPFKDGDTLLSWEKGGHTSFRTHIAACLRELGYEVEER